MNTLTSGFKPIQLLKLNTNLLSVISFIVLSAMIFIPMSVSAECCCDTAEEELSQAEEALSDAEENYRRASDALDAVLRRRPPDWEAIEDATEIVEIAEQELEDAQGAYWDAYIYYLVCIALCDCYDSGGCDSGGCDSGGCG